jgi:hypothetical protein
MTSRAGGNRYNAVDAHVRTFAGVPIVRHVVKDQSAVCVNSGDHVRAGSQRQNDDRDAVPYDDIKVGLQPRVGSMTNKIDRVRRFATYEVACYAHKIAVKNLRCPRVQRGRSAYDPCPALSDDKRRRRRNEHWAGHDRQLQLRLESCGQASVAGHCSPPSLK